MVPVGRAALASRLEAGEIDVALAPAVREAPGVRTQGLYATELAAPRDAAEHFAKHFALRVDDPPLPLPKGMVAMMWHERFAKDPAQAWLRALLGRCVPAGRKCRRAR